MTKTGILLQLSFQSVASLGDSLNLGTGAWVSLLILLLGDHGQIISPPAFLHKMQGCCED
jgi:hypothetical protein